MDDRGIEPMTSRMRSEHSTPELDAQKITASEESNVRNNLFISPGNRPGYLGLPLRTGLSSIIVEYALL